MKTTYKAGLILIIITFTTMLSMTLTSCFLPGLSGYQISDLGNGYKRFTLQKGVGHFSLEYPNRFEISIVETRNDEHIYTSVDFDSWDNKTDIQFSFFGVFIDDKKDTPNIESMLQSHIKFESSRPEYKLIELSEINISGRNAKKYVYSTKSVQPPYSKIPSCTFINTDIIFDTYGFVWRLSMNSPVWNAEIDKADLEHIIGSFKILD